MDARRPVVGMGREGACDREALLLWMDEVCSEESRTCEAFPPLLTETHLSLSLSLNLYRHNLLLFQKLIPFTLITPIMGFFFFNVL